MDVKDAHQTLQDHSLFSEWKQEHEEAYFTHAFKMEGEGDGEWQLGYYDKKSEHMKTFVVNGDDVSVRDDEEVFSKDPQAIQAIELAPNHLTYQQIVKLSQDFQKKEYPKDPAMKIISILQHIPEHGMCWNITHITQAFNTLNMKLDPVTGEVKEHKLSSIFSFKADDQNPDGKNPITG